MSKWFGGKEYKKMKISSIRRQDICRRISQSKKGTQNGTN